MIRAPKSLVKKVNRHCSSGADPFTKLDSYKNDNTEGTEQGPCPTSLHVADSWGIWLDDENNTDRAIACKKSDCFESVVPTTLTHSHTWTNGVCLRSSCERQVGHRFIQRNEKSKHCSRRAYSEVRPPSIVLQTSCENTTTPFIISKSAEEAVSESPTSFVTDNDQLTNTTGKMRQIRARIKKRSILTTKISPSVEGRRKQRLLPSKPNSKKNPTLEDDQSDDQMEEFVEESLGQSDDDATMKNGWDYSTDHPPSQAAQLMALKGRSSLRVVYIPI